MLKISKILILRENPSSSYEIYYKSKNGKFYYLALQPVLNKSYIPGICTPYTPHQQVFNCFNNIVNVYTVPIPIFRIDNLKEITQELESTKINLFKLWYFPTLRRIINYSEIYKKLPLLEKLRKYIPYTPFNILNANTYLLEEQLNFKRIISKNAKPDDSVYCDLNICPYFEYSGKITFLFNGNRYKLVVNRHLLANGLTKFVVWVFIVNDLDTSNQFENNRFKTIQDLNNPLLFNEIIKRLITDGFYNPKTMFLGFNNFLTIDMESLHFHILPKTHDTFYSSFTETNSYIGIEKRMENCLNAYHKIKIIPDYYVGYNFVIPTALRINNL